MGSFASLLNFSNNYGIRSTNDTNTSVNEIDFQDFYFLPGSKSKKQVNNSLVVDDFNVPYLKLTNNQILDISSFNTKSINPITIGAYLKKESINLKFEKGTLIVRFVYSCIFNINISIYYMVQEYNDERSENNEIFDENKRIFYEQRHKGTYMDFECSLNLDDENFKVDQEDNQTVVPLVIDLSYDDKSNKCWNHFITYLEFDLLKHRDVFNIESLQVSRQYFIYKQLWFFMQNIYGTNNQDYEENKSNRNIKMSTSMTTSEPPCHNQLTTTANQSVRIKNNTKFNTIGNSSSCINLYSSSVSRRISNTSNNLTTNNCQSVINIDCDCVICMSQFADTLLFPCRHLCICRKCAEKLASQQTPHCPICRTAFLLQIQLNDLDDYLIQKKERQPTKITNR